MVYNHREFKHIIQFNIVHYLPPWLEHHTFKYTVMKKREVGLFYKLRIRYIQTLANLLFILSVLKVIQPTISGNKTE